MEFYHGLITKKSFQTLQELKRKFNFILIGGWAIFLYAHALKSKDVDIIVDYDELEKLKKEYDIIKNDRLRKYEMKMEGIDIDIYLPFFSQIGFPLEDFKNYLQSQEGFMVPKPEVLLIMKVYVAQERKGTTKGRKDIMDIFSLLSKKIIKWQDYHQVIEKYHLKNLQKELITLVANQKAIPELNLLNHQISRLKKEVLKNLI